MGDPSLKGVVPLRLLHIFLCAIALMAASFATAQAATPGIKGGKFEVTCFYVRSLQADPIVSPGIFPSAHLHDFFGNTGVDQNSTPSPLVGGPTSCKLKADSAAYWVPAAYRTDTGAQVKPTKVFAYYFGTPGVQVEPMPAGLEMVAGNHDAMSPADENPVVIRWSCGEGASGNHSPVRSFPYNCLDPNYGVTNSQGVVAVIKFPYCWDGTGLHPSDVVYGDSTGVCPMGFDQHLPQVQEHVHYGYGAGDPRNFERGDLLTLSSGPYYTEHADYIQSWVQSKMDSLTVGCLDTFKDCGFLSDSKNPGP